MAFEDDRAKINAVIERARRGDKSLSDAQIVAALDEFDGALAGRLNDERAAELLLLAAAPLCFYCASVGAQAMPIALWALSQMGRGTNAEMAAALSHFADYAASNSWLETPVLDWLRQSARDETTLEKWLGTVRAWEAQE